MKHLTPERGLKGHQHREKVWPKNLAENLHHHAWVHIAYAEVAVISLDVVYWEQCQCLKAREDYRWKRRCCFQVVRSREPEKNEAIRTVQIETIDTPGARPRGQVLHLRRMSSDRKRSSADSRYTSSHRTLELPITACARSSSVVFPMLS